MTRFVGLDPCPSGGGIAWINDTSVGSAIPWPRTESQILSVIDSVLNIGESFGPDSSVIACVERVCEPLGVIGLTHSSFMLGRFFGFLRGVLSQQALVSDRMSWFDMGPQEWQLRLGLRRDLKGVARKQAILAIATQRLPGAPVTLSTCSALLIADWLRSQHQPCIK